MSSRNAHDECPVAETFEILASKWKSPIIYHLTQGTKRFGELRRLIPEVTQKMLTQQLRSLERDGIVNRQQYPEIPPRVEYSLTEIGESLNSVYGQLVDWLNTHRDAIEKARVGYDNKR